MLDSNLARRIPRSVGVAAGVCAVYGALIFAQSFAEFESGAEVSASGVNANFTSTRDRLAPVGSIVAWNRDFPTLPPAPPPTLPDGWVECDGSVLNDTESIYHGLTLPNLNGTNYVLQGSTTSNFTSAGGNHGHTHTLTTGIDGTHTHTTLSSVSALASLGNTNDGIHAHTVSTGSIANSGNLLTAYRVVFIMRVK